jgi:hypothetical protein
MGDLQKSRPPRKVTTAGPPTSVLGMAFATFEQSHAGLVLAEVRLPIPCVSGAVSATGLGGAEFPYMRECASRRRYGDDLEGRSPNPCSMPRTECARIYFAHISPNLQNV